MFQSKRKKYRLKSDEDLVVLYKESQEDLCITILYERYAHLVLGTSIKYMKDVTKAEDLSMELFASLGEKLLKHHILHFKSWLYTVTKNNCYMELRKNKKEFTSDNMEQFDDILDETDLNQLESKLIYLEESIATLKEDQQDCIRLFFLENKSYSEISNLLSISLLKVKSAVQNGKRNLKLKFENYHEVE
jgi:RNA polymerase sigma factor (sigma-70 family)